MKNPRNKNIQKPTKITFPKRIPRGTPIPTTSPTRIPPNTTATVVSTAPIAQPKNFPTAKASRNNTKRNPKNNLKILLITDIYLIRQSQGHNQTEILLIFLFLPGENHSGRDRSIQRK